MRHWNDHNNSDIDGGHRTWYQVEGAGGGADAVRTVLIGSGAGGRRPSAATASVNSGVGRGREVGGAPAAGGRRRKRVRMKSGARTAGRKCVNSVRVRSIRHRIKGGRRKNSSSAENTGGSNSSRNVRTARASNKSGSENATNVNRRQPLRRILQATTVAAAAGGDDSTSNHKNNNRPDNIHDIGKEAGGGGGGVSLRVNRINQQQTLLQTPTATTTTTTTTAGATRATTLTFISTTTIKPNATIMITTTTARATIGYILITDYDQLQPKSFWQKYGCTLLIAAGITLCGATISISIAVIHCARSPAAATPSPPPAAAAAFAARRRAATRRASVALAAPIPLLPEDRTPLHAEPEHPVPMLSVQTAGCAGMERLGVPARTSLNTPPDDRGQFSRRMRVDALQARELLAVRASGETVIRASNSSSSNNHHQHHHQQHPRVCSGGSAVAGSSSISSRSGFGGSSGSSHGTTINSSSSNIARGGIEATTLKYGNTGSGSGHGSSSTGRSCGSHSVSSANSHSHDHHQHYQQDLQQQQTLRCPHHVPLPDSEWGQDRDLQIRTRYQQSEITRSYIKPPPNKTVKDVPEQSSYNFYSLTSPAATTATATTLAQQLHHHPGYHNAHGFHQGTSSASASAGCSTQQQQHKSKSNVIMKLWSRKSSPKSPTALAASSTCSSLASSASLGSMPSAASSVSVSASSSSSSASVSNSSSASSLSSAQSLPVSTASALTTTACSYGPSGCATPPTGGNNILAGLAPTTQLLTTIGVSSSSSPTAGVAANASPTPPLVRIPTPPLSVSVPISYQQQQQHKQFQQQLLLDSIVAESATSTAALQTLKSNSCSLATSPLGAMAAASDVVPMDCCQLRRAGRQQSLSPAAGRARSSSNELSAPIGGGISRNSSNCSMNCCCNNAAGCGCSDCNGTATSSPQRAHLQDHQHTL